jgi:hypothetical protein
VPVVHRPDPQTLVIDLTRRLAEEYAAIPIPSVRSAVNSAVAASELFGNDIAASLETIEQLAREDLNAVRAAAADNADVGFAPEQR